VNKPNDGNPANLVHQHVVEPKVPRVHKRVPILGQRNQDPDQIVRQAQQCNLEGRNNTTNVVETLLTQNGFNLCLHRPNFVSPLSEYVTMKELPRGWKIPKFTKFGGETNESTVEHIARYLTEAGDGIKPQVHGLIIVVIKEYRSNRELFNSINLNIMIRREINCELRVFKG